MGQSASKHANYSRINALGAFSIGEAAVMGVARPFCSNQRELHDLARIYVWLFNITG